MTTALFLVVRMLDAWQVERGEQAVLSALRARDLQRSPDDRAFDRDQVLAFR